ncbi:MAG: hypothetical protein JJ936_01400, partial [Psychroserpens sp.]|nr:hypothetical protein [Psychroserpens sp.]
MRSLVVSFIFLFSGMIFAQSEDLADEYFKRGEFEKALISYQKLYETKRSSKLVYKIVGTLQQLERYDDAEATLRESMKIFKFPAFLVELGYNYQLKDSLNQANSYYRQALDEIPLKPTSAYTIAKKFQDHSLLEEALEAYELAMEANPKMNFNIQMARIYGELGNIELLFSNYLDYVSEKPSFLSNAKRAFSDFISENKENENNLILRKLLLKKIQSQPDPYWYDFLSWLYIQQKEYNKAFTQEKALYRRTQESLSRIIDLAMTTINEEDYEVSNSIFNY